MSVIDIGVAKSFLDVIHDDDDEKIQLLLDAAEDEAKEFIDRDDLIDWGPCCSESSSSSASSSEPDMPASVKLGILILLQGAYQASPQDQAQLRKVAETKLMPYRCRLGV